MSRKSEKFFIRDGARGFWILISDLEQVMTWAFTTLNQDVKSTLGLRQRSIADEKFFAFPVPAKNFLSAMGRGGWDILSL